MQDGVPARRVAVPLRISQRAATARAGASVKALCGETMGTRWSVRLVVEESRELASIVAEIASALDGVIAEMSTWEAGSAISRINAAPAGSWHALPANFYRVLEYALAVARDTEGAFDPTVGRLVALWGFGAGAEVQCVPTAEAVAAARVDCGWARIELDKPRRAALQPGGVRLDLSSVAKGFAVDRVAAVVREAGVESFLVEIGGELRGEGVKPDGMPWWVALERPRGSASGAAPIADIVVALNGLAVATSGSAEHFFSIGGRTFSHTIDPRTGSPVAHDLVSVSVLHRECMHADALATALSVLGPDAGMEHALRLGLAARFVSAVPGGYRERLTPQLAAMLA
ncbi:FAD:protein FMN transferase [Hyphomicrobium sp. 1Nfss2.1]|uniref:FAD:protein FMN transferase n=1 Tax=Hyphomicrobium sp. 1Nfss2.1 TaxID=3413936 RepID=UPI003C7DD71B